MKIVFTKHALRKKEILDELGWDINLDQVEDYLNNPDLKGMTNKGQPTAIKFLDERHFLRIVYEIRNGIIMVITIHISTKGRYAT